MTRIEVAADAVRARCDLSGGPLSPRLLRGDHAGARVALVATTALLLGGDVVTLDVRVGAGAWLEVVETAGTVAYPGPRATWHVDVQLGPGAVLVWAGLPFVVCEGADVARSTSLDLADGARAVVRETTVLGRVGEGPGAIRTRLSVRHDDGELLVEDLALEASAVAAPGILGGRRVIDTVAALGFRPDPDPEREGRAGVGRAADLASVPGDADRRRRRLDLAGPGALSRFLGTAAHSSGLAADLDRWAAQAHAR